MKIWMAAATLVLSSCSQNPAGSDPHGRYVSDPGDISESLTLAADGTYSHQWTANDANSETGTWALRRRVQGDCVRLELRDFTVVRRDFRPTSHTDTFSACIDTTLFGEAYIVLNEDQGTYLRKVE